jgi:hypothetical protein
MITFKAYRSAPVFAADKGSLGPGYYFTTDPNVAKKYAAGSEDIVQVKISLSNPISGVKTTIASSIGLKEHYQEDQWFDTEVGAELGKLARRLNHDGIVAMGRNGKTLEIVVFDKASFTVTAFVAPWSPFQG